jgi:hypothetical protein
MRLAVNESLLLGFPSDPLLARQGCTKKFNGDTLAVRFPPDFTKALIAAAEKRRLTVSPGEAWVVDVLVEAILAEKAATALGDFWWAVLTLAFPFAWSQRGEVVENVN